MASQLGCPIPNDRNMEGRPGSRPHMSASAVQQACSIDGSFRMHHSAAHGQPHLAAVPPPPPPPANAKTRAVVRSMLHRCIALGANVGARRDPERAHVRVNAR